MLRIIGASRTPVENPITQSEENGIQNLLPSKQELFDARQQLQSQVMQLRDQLPQLSAQVHNFVRSAIIKDLQADKEIIRASALASVGRGQFYKSLHGYMTVDFGIMTKDASGLLRKAGHDISDDDFGRALLLRPPPQTLIVAGFDLAQLPPFVMETDIYSLIPQIRSSFGTVVEGYTVHIKESVFHS
jgi:hypothetical protein